MDDGDPRPRGRELGPPDRRAPLEFLAGFLGDPEAEARAHLSQEAAQRAFQQGRTMSVDMALALALAVGQDATAG